MCSRIAPTTRKDDDEVASADGIRFVVPVATVHVGPNPKYFGIGRGVTYYNLTSNQFTGLNAITVSPPEKILEHRRSRVIKCKGETKINAG